MEIVTGIAAFLALVLVVRLLATRGERLTSAATDSVAAPVTDEAVRELLLRGRKIQAIKTYRTLHGVDLKNAKEAVERLAARLPLER